MPDLFVMEYFVMCVNTKYYQNPGLSWAVVRGCNHSTVFSFLNMLSIQCPTKGNITQNLASAKNSLDSDSLNMHVLLPSFAFEHASPVDRCAFHAVFQSVQTVALCDICLKLRTKSFVTGWCYNKHCWASTKVRH